MTIFESTTLTIIYAALIFCIGFDKKFPKITSVIMPSTICTGTICALVSLFLN
jgi:hypothetical protein